MIRHLPWQQIFDLNWLSCMYLIKQQYFGNIIAVGVNIIMFKGGNSEAWDERYIKALILNVIKPACKLLQPPVPNPDSKVHRADMLPIWVLSAQEGPHVGPMLSGKLPFSVTGCRRHYHASWTLFGRKPRSHIAKLQPLLCSSWRSAKFKI